MGAKSADREATPYCDRRWHRVFSAVVVVSHGGGAWILRSINLIATCSMSKADKALEVENERMRLQVTGLRSDPYQMEKLAREDLGLVRPDEIIFEIVDGRPEDSPWSGLSVKNSEALLLRGEDRG